MPSAAYQRAIDPTKSRAARMAGFFDISDPDEAARAWLWMERDGLGKTQGLPKGVKADDGKPRPSLLFASMPDAVRAVIDVLEHGARKYAPDNWRKVEGGRARYQDAALRHMLAHAAGEDRDPESRLPHLAHAICSLMFILQLTADDD